MLDVEAPHSRNHRTLLLCSDRARQNAATRAARNKVTAGRGTRFVTGLGCRGRVAATLLELGWRVVDDMRLLYRVQIYSETHTYTYIS